MLIDLVNNVEINDIYTYITILMKLSVFYSKFKKKRNNMQHCLNKQKIQEIKAIV